MNHTLALYAREVKRFQKMLLDTVFSPIVSMGLYLAVFGVVLGNQTIGNIPYVAFVYTGLLTMLIVNSSFSNPGFALVIAKNLGTIIDLQVVPLRPWKIGFAYALAALSRAAFTLLLAILITVWFVPGFSLEYPLFFLGVLLVTGLQYGMLGVIFGMWARNFEALTFITTFVLQPMIFLAGVFYPVANLPEPWFFISQFNPIHHNVNLFRYALVGYTDAPLINSIIIVGICFVALLIAMHYSCERNLKR